MNKRTIWEVDKDKLKAKINNINFITDNSDGYKVAKRAEELSVIFPDKEKMIFDILVQKLISFSDGEFKEREIKEKITRPTVIELYGDNYGTVHFYDHHLGAIIIKCEFKDDFNILQTLII